MHNAGFIDVLVEWQSCRTCLPSRRLARLDRIYNPQADLAGLSVANGVLADAAILGEAPGGQSVR